MSPSSLKVRSQSVADAGIVIILVDFCQVHEAIYTHAKPFGQSEGGAILAIAVTFSGAVHVTFYYPTAVLVLGAREPKY